MYSFGIKYIVYKKILIDRNKKKLYSIFNDIQQNYWWVYQNPMFNFKPDTRV